MVNDEFVDLDEIVPGTGFRKKPDEQPPKKEIKPKIQESVPEPEPKSVEQKQPKPEKQDIQKIVDSTDSEEIEEETVNFQKQIKVEYPKESSPVEKKIKEEKPEKRRSEALSNKSEKKEVKTQSVKEEIKKKPVHKFHKDESKTQEKKHSEKESVKKSTLVENYKKNKETKETRETKSSKKEAYVKPLKKSLSRKPEGKETNWTLVALLILGAVIIGVIVYMALKFDFPGSNQESVVAVVNGQPIYKSEIANRYNLLTSTMNPSIDEFQVLNLTITDKLLLQEAEKRGIKTSDEEVNILLDEIMIQNNISEESLRGDLEAKNVSYDFLFNLYKNTLTINKLINESFSNVSLSDEEIEAFYDANKESIKVPDMVQVRHILFMYGTNTDNDTFKKADEVAQMIKLDRSNFCSLVSTYTEDVGSKETCGEYNFSADYPFVPEFLEAGFSMNPGEVKIVKTQIGYHVMYKVANLPGYIPRLEDIKDKLSPVLMEEKTLKELQALIADLQSNAIIEIYNETISTKRFKEIAIDNKPKISAEQIAASEEPIAVQETPVQEEKEVIQETPVQESQEVVVTKAIVNTPSSQKFILATCLADKGYRMFTASWSPDSQTQLNLFGEYASNLVIVECDPESNVANIAECSKVLVKQYPTWPTWQINGTLYEGIQSLATLSKYSGCPY